LRLFEFDALSVRWAARIAGWSLLAVVAFFSLSPASVRPVTAVGHSMEHFLVHILLGVAFGIGYAKRIWLQSLGLVALIGAIELAQIFVPGRHARLSDFLIDGGAASLGIALVWICKALAGAGSWPTASKSDLKPAPNRIDRSLQNDHVD
jgi:VanZ family protein